MWPRTEPDVIGSQEGGNERWDPEVLPFAAFPEPAQNSATNWVPSFQNISLWGYILY